jgi:hypothetical protein
MNEQGALLLRPQVTLWECPSCGLTDATTEVQPHTRMHTCRALAQLTVPMVPAGTRAEHRRIERGDWVGREMVQTDAEGRPWMAVQTMRADGYDTTVYAPTALATRD